MEFIIYETVWCYYLFNSICFMTLTITLSLFMLDAASVHFPVLNFYDLLVVFVESFSHFDLVKYWLTLIFLSAYLPICWLTFQFINYYVLLYACFFIVLELEKVLNASQWLRSAQKSYMLNILFSSAIFYLVILFFICIGLIALNSK